MEPMALGSPPSPTNNYLPSFLMGDPASPPMNQSMNVVSPARNKTPNFSFSRTPGGDCKNMRQKLFKDNAESSFNAYSGNNLEKGPPRESLFDTLASEKKAKTPMLSSTMHPMSEHAAFIPNDSFSRIGNESLNVSQNIGYDNNATMNGNETGYRMGQKRTTTWVTVFGFPPSSASIALSHFTTCGHIVDKKFPTQSNYVHIKFSNSYEASKALTMNGKTIMNGIMIGVMLYYPDENKENLNASALDVTSPIRVRSLRHSFVSPPMNTSAVQSPNVPQKSTGLVTKAMEYVFGW